MEEAAPGWVSERAHGAQFSMDQAPPVWNLAGLYGRHERCPGPAYTSTVAAALGGTASDNPNTAFWGSPLDALAGAPPGSSAGTLAGGVWGRPAGEQGGGGWEAGCVAQAPPGYQQQQQQQPGQRLPMWQPLQPPQQEQQGLTEGYPSLNSSGTLPPQQQQQLLLRLQQEALLAKLHQQTAVQREIVHQLERLAELQRLVDGPGNMQQQQQQPPPPAGGMLALPWAALPAALRTERPQMVPQSDLGLLSMLGGQELVPQQHPLLQQQQQQPCSLPAPDPAWQPTEQLHQWAAGLPPLRPDWAPAAQQGLEQGLQQWQGTVTSSSLIPNPGVGPGGGGAGAQAAGGGASHDAVPGGAAAAGDGGAQGRGPLAAAGTSAAAQPKQQ